jgi:hypothetical protein
MAELAVRCTADDDETDGLGVVERFSEEVV